MSDIGGLTKKLEEDVNRAEVWANGPAGASYTAKDGIKVPTIRTLSEKAEISTEKAEDSAKLAEESSKKAINAAAAANLSSGIFSSINDGLEKTADGEIFNVLSKDNYDFIELYKNNNGIAEFLKSYPSSAVIEEIKENFTPMRSNYLSIAGEDDFELAYIGKDKIGVHGLFEISNDNENQLLIVGSDHFAYELKPDVAIEKERIAFDEVIFANKLVIPSNGLVIDIRSMLKQRGLQSKDLQIICSLGNRNGVEYYSGRDYLFIPADTTPGQYHLCMRNTSDNSIFQMPIEIMQVNKNISDVNILMIGDSITNRQLGFFINNILVKHGVTPNFIGTMNGSATSVSADDSGVLGEAKEGWETGDFTFQITDRAKPIIEGSEDDYLKLSKQEKWNFSPFIRKAIEADQDSILNNGYVVDFNFYQQRFKLDTPDVVVIQLGTNDIRDRGDDLIDGYEHNMNLLIGQAIKAWPDVKIILSVPGTAFDDARDELWDTKYHPLIRSLMKIHKSMNSKNIILAPSWALTTSDLGFSISANGSMEDLLTKGLIGKWSDPVHLAGCARHQLASVLSAYILS